MRFFGRKPATHSLGEVLRGLQEAVGSVQRMLSAQQAEAVARYWQADGTPVTQRVHVGDRDIDVPLFALVPHGNLMMDGAEFKLKARVGDVASPVTATAPTSALGMAPGSADMQVSLEGVRAQDDDVMEITIRFRAVDPPEGVARLADESCKVI